MLDEQKRAIADLYYRSIDKPESAKEPPQFALCMIGLIGAGKSTVLCKLTLLVPAVRVSGDEVRKLLLDQGLPPTSSETLADIGGLVVAQLAHQGYRIAYDNDFANPQIRRVMLERNQNLGLPVIWIRVKPPREFIINKLRKYRHTWLFKDANDAVAALKAREALHVKESQALDSIPYIYTFDTSAPNLEQQITAAAKKIRLSLKDLQSA